MNFYTNVKVTVGVFLIGAAIFFSLSTKFDYKKDGDKTELSFKLDINK